MCTRSVLSVMQLDVWMYTAWRLSRREICIEEGPLLPWHVCHHKLQHWQYISLLHLLVLSHLTVIRKHNVAYWPSCNLIWVLGLWYGVFDPGTSRDELPCLTLWLLHSWSSWHVAKLVLWLLFTEIWHKNNDLLIYSAVGVGVITISSSDSELYMVISCGGYMHV
jgi:hypothetical protein